MSRDRRYFDFYSYLTNLQLQKILVLDYIDYNCQSDQELESLCCFQEYNFKIFLSAVKFVVNNNKINNITFIKRNNAVMVK